MLYDPDPAKRAGAVIHFKQRGTEEIQRLEALPALVEVMLHDPDGGIRARAAHVLGRVGNLVQRHPKVALTLLSALRDRDAGVRAQAAEACGKLEPPTASQQEILVALNDALEDTDGEVRSAAAEALDRHMARGLRLFKHWWRKKEVCTVEALAEI